VCGAGSIAGKNIGAYTVILGADAGAPIEDGQAVRAIYSQNNGTTWSPRLVGETAI